ncbi:ankyrin repeat domain-containing protein [Ferviditalea candida]|uniref:Ankyrin repeat domain-containing protein n=1 Tax=Ferviditalea candida TaxID=3108399 RepID=A0ABU5ZKJ8_9BACL|nr:ankyrin repeat domain-containing protein [Paenibacillaceae bacterium T2]
MQLVKLKQRRIIVPTLIIVTLFIMLVEIYAFIPKHASVANEDKADTGYNKEMSKPIDANKTTMLMRVSRDGDLEKVEEALQRGANPNDKDVFGQTALTQAVMMNRTDVVKKLIEAGAALDLQRNDGYTPLMLATIDNRPPIVKLLLDAGANPNIEEHQGNTALILAVDNIIHRETQSTYIPELLLSAGADVNHLDKFGHSAMELAVDEKQEKLIALLKNHGAKMPKESDENKNNEKGE